MVLKAYERGGLLSIQCEAVQGDTLCSLVCTSRASRGDVGLKKTRCSFGVSPGDGSRKCKMLCPPIEQFTRPHPGFVAARTRICQAVNMRQMGFK